VDIGLSAKEAFLNPALSYDRILINASLRFVIESLKQENIYEHFRNSWTRITRANPSKLAINQLVSGFAPHRGVFVHTVFKHDKVSAKPQLRKCSILSLRVVLMRLKLDQWAAEATKCDRRAGAFCDRFRGSNIIFCVSSTSREDLTCFLALLIYTVEIISRYKAGILRYRFGRYSGTPHCEILLKIVLKQCRLSVDSVSMDPTCTRPQRFTLFIANPHFSKNSSEDSISEYSQNELLKSMQSKFC